jgi:hypothetical protein
LLCHGKNGYLKAAQYYVTRALPVLFYLPIKPNKVQLYILLFNVDCINNSKIGVGLNEIFNSGKVFIEWRV